MYRFSSRITALFNIKTLVKRGLLPGVHSTCVRNYTKLSLIGTSNIGEFCRYLVCLSANHANTLNLSEQVRKTAAKSWSGLTSLVLVARCPKIDAYISPLNSHHEEALGWLNSRAHKSLDKHRYDHKDLAIAYGIAFPNYPMRDILTAWSFLRLLCCTSTSLHLSTTPRSVKLDLLKSNLKPPSQSPLHEKKLRMARACADPSSRAGLAPRLLGPSGSRFMHFSLSLALSAWLRRFAWDSGWWPAVAGDARRAGP